MDKILVVEDDKNNIGTLYLSRILLHVSIAGSQRPIELDASMDVEYIFGDYL